MKFASIFSEDYLVSTWASEYETYRQSGSDASLLARLQNWDQRDPKLSETQTEAAFIRVFFEELWGFWPTGSREASQGFCMVSQSKVAGAGQTGGVGAADLALGWYGRPGITPVDQVLCEFKDVGSALDAPQRRKGNTRSPVKQCFDYLRYAFDQTPTNSSLRPTWGVVTDMNEFRLYGRRLGEGQVQRFVIRARALESQTSLLEESEAGCQQRFLFSRIFHRELLLAESGATPLERVLDAQGVQERALEGEFYKDYSAYREFLFKELVAANPHYADKKWRLVRLAQRLLDRLLFIMFAEDMGKALRFPRDLLRDTLSEHSRLGSYDPDDEAVWSVVKRLFRSMADGVPFGKKEIPRFNGGLFHEDKELEGLSVPTKVFCVAGQGESPESMLRHPRTLHYFSAKYNFGATGARQQRTIGLYTLGRIFEQSLTDLEVMEAHAAGRESLAEITKRKRDGVYYTPEWVTAYIVQETVGRRLEELKEGIRKELQLPDDFAATNEDISKWRQATGVNRQKGTAGKVESYRTFLDRYVKRLEVFTVVDPACGSGAFLIQALELLLRERRWVAEERGRIEGQLLFDQDALIRETLGNNIFGVDINAESVEITKLALWLHTALPGKPLCALDDNIRCGNSLVGPEFTNWYRKKRGLLFADLDEGVQAKVNVFDWEAAFPKVFAGGGFDAVIGNPPYVKLQHFRRVEADVAEFLTEARRSDGTPVYRSTQTGNFDLYLPFIEKGISLLKQDGRMGFIAPSLWAMNKYGEGLRLFVGEEKALERWFDFRSFQVFEEATTYTAIQLYRKAQAKGVQVYWVPDGDMSKFGTKLVDGQLLYSDIRGAESWTLMPAADFEVFRGITSRNASLESSGLLASVFQGVKTGCDDAFVLERTGDGRFVGTLPDGLKVGVEPEAAMLRPLASGPDIDRFKRPLMGEWLIYPYDANGKLYEWALMTQNWPKTSEWLLKHERVLRRREEGRYDGPSWFQYSRPQNLAQLSMAKILLAGTAPEIRAALDSRGEFSLLGGRAYAVVPKDSGDLSWLTAILNSAVCHFCFQRIARPKSGGFFDIESQFIWPLPIPEMTSDAKSVLAGRAGVLQTLHTRRRDVILALLQRLQSSQTELDQRPESWLWADVKSAKHWAKSAPADRSGRAATAWAKDHFHMLVSQRLEHLSAVLVPGTVLSAQADNGELRVTNHAHVLLRTYEDESTAPFIAAQWRHALRDLRITDGFDSSKLLRLLLGLRKTDNSALRDQVVKLDAEIQQLDRDIASAEAEMNEIIYGLYGLTEEERKVVERG